jgi:hypothetical protein
MCDKQHSSRIARRRSATFDDDGASKRVPRLITETWKPRRTPASGEVVRESNVRVKRSTRIAVAWEIGTYAPKFRLFSLLAPLCGVTPGGHLWAPSHLTLVTAIGVRNGDSKSRPPATDCMFVPSGLRQYHGPQNSGKS